MSSRDGSSPFLAALVVVGSCALPVAAADDGWAALLEGRHEDALTAFAAPADAEDDSGGASLGRAAILLGRGETDAAFAALADGLDDERDPRLVAGAVAAMATLVRELGRAAPEAGAGLAPLATGGADLDPEVRSLALLARADVTLRAGEAGQALESLRRDAGRIGTWRITGPYGRFEHLSLDRRYPPEAGDLDPGDERDGSHAGSQTADVVLAEFADGRIVLPPTMRRPGVAYAAADVRVERPTEFRMRVSAPVSVRVFVNGTPAVEIDRWRNRPPGSVSARIRLGRGVHRVLVKLPAADPDAHASVGLTPMDGPAPVVAAASSSNVETGTASIEPWPCPLDDVRPRAPEARPAEMLAAYWWLRARGLDDAAGAVLESALDAWPDAPLLESMAGEHYLDAETGAAPQEDISRARSLFEAASAAAPDLVRPVLWLARMDLAADRLATARERVTGSLASHPDDPALLRLAFELAEQSGWAIEAARHLDRALLVAPDDPALLLGALGFLRRTGALEHAPDVARRLSERQLHQAAHAAQLAAEGRHEEAIEAWSRLARRQPTEASFWVGLIRAQADAGSLEGAAESLVLARRSLGNEPSLLREEVTLAAISGDRDAALDALERQLDTEPGNVGVRMTLERVGRIASLEHYLADATRILAKAGPRSRGVDSALLADIAAVLVDSEGGQSELYQGIHKVYTRAGVQREGELEVLGGALVESIRMHKPGGRVVDVAPGNQRPVNLPGLEPGDAIEYVWRRYIPPLPGLPGAIDNQTLFVFQAPDRDHVLSRYVVAHDIALPLEVCGNMTDLDASDEIVDGLRVRGYTARFMPRQRVEPHLADQLEVTPHVRLGFGMTWQDLGDRYRDALIGTMRPLAPLRRLEALVRERATDDGPLALARSLHAVVTEQLRPGDSPLRLDLPASGFASSGEGNRAGVAIAVAAQLGLDPRLVLARPLERKGLALDCPSPGLFGYVLVELDAGGRIVYLDFTEHDNLFDSLPLRVSGSDALRVPVDTGRSAELIELPPQSDDPLQELEARVALDSEGRVTGIMRSTLHRETAAATRSVLERVASDRLPLVFRTVASNVFEGAEVSDARVEESEIPGGPLVFALEIERGAWARRTPTGFAIPMTTRPLELLSEFASLETRLYPLLLDPHAMRRDEVRVEIARGLEVDSLPEPVQLESPFGSYRLEARLEGEDLVFTRHAAIPPSRIEPQDYARFREFARAIAEAERHEVPVSVASPSLAR